MRRTLLSMFISGLCFSLLNGQSADQNYIRIITPSITTSDASSLVHSQCITRVQYYDGLGRSAETVMKSITPQMNDLVSMVEYDTFGRMSHEWQPVAMGGTSGEYRPTSDVKARSSSLYGDEYAYTSTYYDSSPLNRVVKQIGPGADWHVNDKAQRTEYQVNTATGELSVPCFVVENNRLKRSGFYPASSLIITLTKDEDDVACYDFVDLEGKRIKYKGVIYVYDNLGQLRYVLPPFFFNTYGSSVSADGFYDVTPETGLYKMCYVYNYDDRGNCISKKLPGIEPIYYVYDKADRPVLSQSPNQRARDEWSFTKYDALSRPILSGTTKISGKSHGQLCEEYRNQLSKETFTGSIVSDCYGYSNVNLPTRNLTILKVDFYDNYTFIGNLGLPSLFNYQMQSGFSTSYLTTPKGVHTGSIVKVFDSTVTNKFYSVFYYDTKGRVIQSCNNNSLAGFDTYFTSYNFSGSPVDMLHIHSSSMISSLNERYHYTYDHGGRLTQTTHSLNSGAERILAQNEYDELGHLRKKSYPGNLDSATYGYNVRGWIDQINSTHYRQAIYYGFWQNKSKSCYNGNPAGASYSTTYRDPVTGALVQTGEQLAEYGYNNDILSSSVSKKVSNGQFISNVMSETISPITAHAISRSYKGRNEDDLRLNLKGYELDRLYEGGMNNVSSLPIQFTSKYPNMTPTFFYDDNGNLYKDLNRGITGIDYNLLNLPEKITFENSSNIRYRYDADGTKLRADYKTVFNELYTPIGLPVQASSGTLTVEHHIDYCDNLIYEDNVLKKIRVDGGYINYNPSTNNGEYCYYITDQIGSNRVILSETRGVIQYADYYPYGIPFSEIPMEEDNFLHAGKELEKMHGLYWYDNGKRWYDPILCRFTTMDPLCEKYYDKNPYSYCADNPMRYGDVNGDSIWFTFDKDVITMHVTGKVLNDSNNDVDMESAIENITTGIIRAFSGAIDGISFNVDVQLSEAKNMDGVEGSDHLFVLTDKISEIKEGEVYGASNALGGKVAFINSDYFTGPYDRMLGSRNYGTFTATHEFGHLSGLEHNKRNPFNLMRSNGSFYNLNSTQLKTVYSKWKNKELNKRYNYEINPLGRKRPNRGKASIYVRP